jgi:hypothetical protein
MTLLYFLAIHRNQILKSGVNNGAINYKPLMKIKPNMPYTRYEVQIFNHPSVFLATHKRRILKYGVTTMEP